MRKATGPGRPSGSGFDQFEEYIPHSAPREANRPWIGEYSHLICGSDQVWNPSWWNETLLLEGVDGQKTRKSSYAASLGVSELNAWDSARLASALKDFRWISVREGSAKQVLDGLNLSQTVHVDLDPTLLLTQADWLGSLPAPGRDVVPSNPYALVYLVQDNSAIRQFCLDFCSQEGLAAVVVAYGASRGSDHMTREFVTVEDCSPDEWARLLNSASVVLTDSFHGTAFSVNFERPFWCFQKETLMNGNARDDRQAHLLSVVGLTDRLIDIRTCRASDVRGTSIDFGSARVALEQSRAESLRWLDMSVRQ